MWIFWGRVEKAFVNNVNTLLICDKAIIKITQTNTNPKVLGLKDSKGLSFPSLLKNESSGRIDKYQPATMEIYMQY